MAVLYGLTGEVSAAARAAQKKDENLIVKKLLAAGKWTFDTATEIGVSVVAHLIEQNMPK